MEPLTQVVLLFFAIAIAFLFKFCNCSDPSYPEHYYRSNSTLYASNSTYQSNLNTLLSSLSSYAISNSNNALRNTTLGQNSNTVYGFYHCGGDDTSDVCSNCINTAVCKIAQLCHNMKVAYIWFRLLQVCQLAESNTNALFLKVNYEKLKTMCYSLNIHVLPFFRFYRGAEGRLCSFSYTNATIKKFKDALAKHGTDRCSLGPAKGLDESEILMLASNGQIPNGFPLRSTGEETVEGIDLDPDGGGVGVEELLINTEHKLIVPGWFGVAMGVVVGEGVWGPSGKEGRRRKGGKYESRVEKQCFAF